MQRQEHQRIEQPVVSRQRHSPNDEVCDGHDHTSGIKIQGVPGSTLELGRQDQRNQIGAIKGL
jgi:hypothetical protein